MKKIVWPCTLVAVALVLAVLSGGAVPAEDKYTLKVPNGLAFSEFRGYGDNLPALVTTEP